jgi:hypothetical protein
MRESFIEGKVCDYAKANGWVVYKFSSPSCRGVPDRIFLKDGSVFFIEFKATGGKVTKLQRAVHIRIESKGIKVYVVDDIEIGKGIVDGQERFARIPNKGV